MCTDLSGRGQRTFTFKYYLKCDATAAPGSYPIRLSAYVYLSNYSYEANTDNNFKDTTFLLRIR